MTSLLAWVADLFLGPACPVCGHRARGWRTLLDHYDTHPTHDPGGTTSGA